MQDVELFVHLAEIAGVFVGFGALIAIRSGGASGMEEVARMRVLVSMGVMSVIIALAPITLSRYGVTGHQLWAPCGVLVLVSWVVAVVAMLQTPEYREAWAKEIEADRTKPAGPGLIVGSAVYIGYVLASLLTPIVVPANHAVVRVGEPADSMYFVVSGRLEIEIPPEPVWVEEGDFFGEMAIIEARRRGITERGVAFRSSAMRCRMRSPRSWMSPLASAAGMKPSGRTVPSARGQRTSASYDASPPSVARTIGW